MPVRVKRKEMRRDSETIDLRASGVSFRSLSPHTLPSHLYLSTAVPKCAKVSTCAFKFSWIEPPEVPRKGEMVTARRRGNVSPLSTKSGQQASTERRSREIIGEQSRSVPATTDDSYDSTTQGHGSELRPVAMHRPPYMDVQTVKTNLTVDQAAKLEVK